jgi:hypothetical protein
MPQGAAHSGRRARSTCMYVHNMYCLALAYALRLRSEDGKRRGLAAACHMPSHARPLSNRGLELD